MKESLSQRKPNPILFLTVGILIGLVVAGSFWFIANNRSKNESPPLSLQKKLSLNLKTPLQYLATSEKTLIITGSAGVKSIVTISTPTQNKIINTSSGTFSTQVDLVEGKNIIKITAFDSTNGNSIYETREVLYLNEDLSSL